MIQSLRKQFKAADFTTNFFSGLAVGVIALPLSMALAIAAGVPPQHGLYTAIIAGIVISISGGSRFNISGPTAAFVVVLLPIVHTYGLGGLLISGLLAGIILIIMGVLKLGKLIEIVPYPVTVGFTAGIGVVIGTFQLPDFLGLKIPQPGEHYVDKIASIYQALPSLNWMEFAIALLTLSVLVMWPKLKTKIPAHLIALVVGGLTAWILTLYVPGFEVATLKSRFHYDILGSVGNGIPPSLPAFEWPWNLKGGDAKVLVLSFSLIRSLLPGAFTIAILGALESLLCSVVADGMTGTKHDSNRELIGQGLGNIAVSFFGGLPATAAIARTTANIGAGGNNLISSIVHSLFLIISIVVLAPLLNYIPMASMAALLVIVAWNMSEAKHFLRIVKLAPKDDVMILLTCFFLTVIFDMTIAVAIGMGLAAVLFIKRSVRLVNSLEVTTKHAESRDATIRIYSIQGPLFFGSAERAMKNICLVSNDVQTVILDMEAVTMIDMTAIIALENIVEDLQDAKISLVLSSLEGTLKRSLEKMGLSESVDGLFFSATVDEALGHAKKLH